MEEGNFPIKLRPPLRRRASAAFRPYRARGYVPFLFSARFSFSTSEVPGSPPSTNLARQAFGQRRHARIASATRVDFFFGGVDALVASFFILEAAAAMASMVGAGAQGRRAARNGPRGCQI